MAADPLRDRWKSSSACYTNNDLLTHFGLFRWKTTDPLSSCQSVDFARSWPWFTSIEGSYIAWALGDPEWISHFWQFVLLKNLDYLTKSPLKNHKGKRYFISNWQLLVLNSPEFEFHLGKPQFCSDGSLK